MNENQEVRMSRIATEMIMEKYQAKIEEVLNKLNSQSNVGSPIFLGAISSFALVMLTKIPGFRSNSFFSNHEHLNKIVTFISSCLNYYYVWRNLCLTLKIANCMESATKNTCQSY